MLPMPFVPDPSAPEVQKLRQSLPTNSEAVKVRVEVARDAKPRDCYENVRKLTAKRGGSMQLGRAVWQHADVFIEGEAHAIWDPGDGTGWVDVTPHVIDGVPCREITFIPDPGAAYDFNSDQRTDNVRVALTDDARVAEALQLLSKKAQLFNSVPGIDVKVPPAVAAELQSLDRRVANLIFAATHKPRSQSPARSTKIGRNEPCYCESGKKYKKCHGV